MHLENLRLDKLPMASIMILCTANMCRSPMAEALLRQKLQQRTGTADWKVESAGTWTEVGRPVATKTQEVMQGLFGLDLSAHRSRLVSRSLLRPFDLILVMEAGHKEAIGAEFPELASRVFLMYEMVGEIRNVDDPIGGTTADFEDTAHELDRILTQGLEEIVRLAGGQKQEEVGP
jgi:protein-tyrosine phosphatase